VTVPTVTVWLVDVTLLTLIVPVACVPPVTTACSLPLSVAEPFADVPPVTGLLVRLGVGAVFVERLLFGSYA
jgi:hypothetical protein